MSAGSSTAVALGAGNTELRTGPPSSRLAVIAALNDQFRRSLIGGEVMLSAGVAALPPDAIASLLKAVRGFERFDADDDPYGEHDFGALTAGAVRAFWKIDCFDRSLRRHSPDAADPAATVRVLTVMLASEY